MGRFWYIYRYMNSEWLIFRGFHVGKYTSPMDPQGNNPNKKRGRYGWRNWIFFQGVEELMDN